MTPRVTNLSPTIRPLARPAPDESAPAYHTYIDAVTEDDPGGDEGGAVRRQLRSQAGELRAQLGPLDDAVALGRYAPGKWSVKEVLAHLIDAERIFAYRLLRIGRHDATPLPGFDEQAYIPAGRFDRRPLEELLTDFDATRAGTVRLVDGMPDDAWDVRGEASGFPVTPRALLYIIVGHVAHHRGVLRDRYGLAG